MQVLAFAISELQIGLAVEDVVEAVLAVEIRALPGAPSVVEGLIDFRGTIVPVFDMRLRFLGVHADIVPSDRLIIASAARRLVALHVERMVGLVDLPDDAMSRADSRTATTSHVAGVASTPDGLLLIHDLATFLSTAERETLDTALNDSVALR